MPYKIVRFFRGGGNEDRETELTLEEVQEHCNNPETATKDYFDGYTKEELDD